MGSDVEAGRILDSPGHLSSPDQRVARVIPDIAGVDAEFDYLVPEKFASQVRVGTIVRVTLHGRRVRAWVIDDNATPPPGIRLLEIQKVTGWGPPDELIELAAWAARRWIGKRSFHLQTASPLRVVHHLPTRGPNVASGDSAEVVASSKSDLKLLCLPPAESPLETVLDHDAKGPVLLVTPSQRSAEGWVRRLRSEGRAVAAFPEDWARAAAGGVTVVGTRAAVWAPIPDLTAIIVLDAHDRALQSESSPTWHAVDVARERASRRGVPFLAVSSTPRVAQLDVSDSSDRLDPDGPDRLDLSGLDSSDSLSGLDLETVSRDRERAGWAAVHVVDLRQTDPRSGMYSPPLVELLRSQKRVLCVLNRKGRAQLIACVHCSEIARCEVCESAQESRDEDLRCRRCRVTQPVVCRHCGGTKFKQLRVGVSRVREELEALAQRPVGEVTSDTTESVTTDVTVGTEALLYRVSRADAVVFLDFDQELLSPRINAGEDALILLGRAARIVGGRKRGGVVMVQTRQPDHEVVAAAVHADPSRFLDIDIARRRSMKWPPFGAMAQVSGKQAALFVERVKSEGSTEVMGPIGDRWLVRADSHARLADALWAAKPQKGVRIEVDPPTA